MNNKNLLLIPRSFFDWISFLTQAVPVRSAPTFIELLVGAMLTQAGFVTQAWLAVDMKRHWTSYFKWLQKGKWSWAALGRQLARLVAHWFAAYPKFLVIDDTIVFRNSIKAPDSKIHHQHGSKSNRPNFVRGQSWVSLSIALTNPEGSSWSIPLLSRLSRAAGNTTKLTSAKVLLRAVRGIFPGTTLLADSWYMRKTLILSSLAMGIHVIGQVRKDTALYDLPTPTGKRGRPRKYGEKYTPESVEALPESMTRARVYGKIQNIYYRSVVAKARFLRGRLVRIVWVRLEDDGGRLSKPRLLLTTDALLDPLTIIQNYSCRWSIEPMFNQLKNAWGWKETWQQSRQTLHRWVQILSIGYALPRLLAISGEDQVRELANLAPWRSNHPLTAGRVRLGLQRILGHVRIRDLWNPKSRKFQQPNNVNSLKPIVNYIKAALLL